MDEELRKHRFTLLFGMERSVRYHVKRQQFFDRLHGITSLFNVLLGSAAVIALIKNELGWGIPAGVLVTFLSSLDLVVGYNRKSRQHERSAYKFIELQKKLISCPRDKITESHLSELTRERLAIEAEESPPKLALDSICHNELLRAHGIEDKNEVVKITRIQRYLAQLWDHRPETLVKPGHPQL